MNSLSNFSSGLTQNVKITSTYPLYPHLFTIFTFPLFFLLSPTNPPSPRQKKEICITICLRFLLDDYPGEIGNNSYVFLFGGEGRGDKQGILWSM